MPWNQRSPTRVFRIARTWRITINCLGSMLAFLLISTVATPAGSLMTRSFHSSGLGHSMDVSVYEPDGSPPDAGWPTLFLLHGLGGSHADWAAFGNIDKTLDRLIGTNAIAPLIVVMPDADNSWYVDSSEVGGPGDYETAILKDLRRFIEAPYPARTDFPGRAIAGLSMGGFGALRLSLTDPGTFCAVAALSPAMWQNVPPDEIDEAPEQMELIDESAYFHRHDPVTVTAGVVVRPPGPHFGGAFGTPFNPRRFNRQNVFTLLAEGVKSNAVLPAIFVTVGDDDSHRLWGGAIALFETMQADKRNVEFRVTDWRSHLEALATQHRRRPSIHRHGVFERLSIAIAFMVAVRSNERPRRERRRTRTGAKVR